LNKGVGARAFARGIGQPIANLRESIDEIACRDELLSFGCCVERFLRDVAQI
jgi:hypothetical protein